MKDLQEILQFLFNRKNYTTVVMFVMAIFVIAYATVNYTYPQYKSWVSVTSEIKTQQAEYETLLAQKEQRIKEAKNNLVKYDEIPVKIYTSSISGMPVESASIDFVSTVLKMIENTDNNVMDISYKIDALSDAEKNMIPSNVSVVQLVMTLNGTYTSFMDFISTLYNYEYISTIKSFKAIPLKENKNMLEINVVIWLYVAG